MSRSNSRADDSRTLPAASATAPLVRVLLIEDNEEQMLLVKNALEEFGQQAYQLEWASQLRLGLDRLCEGQVDVVLLDLGLPESAGPVSYIAVREAAPYVPVVVLTADHREQTVQIVIKQGADGYLVKDEVSGLQLIKAIGDAIARKKTQNVPVQRKSLKFTGGVWRWQTTGPVAPLISAADSLRHRTTYPSGDRKPTA